MIPTQLLGRPGGSVGTYGGILTQNGGDGD